MDLHAGTRVLLGVSGGIAAYKAVDLVRRLSERGADVRVMLTDAAAAFVTPLTFQAVSGHPVRTTLLDPQAEAGMDHIELARWAERLVIAPATADVLARLAAGFANDLLTTVALACDAPLYLAPAMNQAMWRHPATQHIVNILRARGAQVLGPAVGAQACGEHGPGRMLEPLEIAEALLPRAARALAGVRVLLTAGPTREPLDPVRFLSNRSSGQMGFALADCLERTRRAGDAGQWPDRPARPVKSLRRSRSKRRWTCMGLSWRAPLTATSSSRPPPSRTIGRSIPPTARSKKRG
jgi:phosphopantothenoylcysteine decarboxylase / phosphopantothenate---cysteine ligase